MFSWLDFTIPGFTQRAQWLRSGRGEKFFLRDRRVFFLRDRRVKTLHSLKFIRYSMYPVL
jgi:hypothetical protein